MANHLTAALAILTCATASAWAESPKTVRVAYFHTELSADGPGLLLRDLRKTTLPRHHAAVLHVVTRNRPDILLLSSLDYDAQHASLTEFQRQLSRNGLDLPHAYAVAPNRGVPTGLDLDSDGRLGEPEDAHSFGEFRGAGGMALLSRYPVLIEQAQSFAAFLWADMPGADIPNAIDGDIRVTLRLSGSGHWDVPVRLPNGAVLHLLALHASPPVFDGPEDRNGRRNADQIRFWVKYLNGWHPLHSTALPPRHAVVLGTLNADPQDGDAKHGALRRLLAHPALQDPAPQSEGGQRTSAAQGGVNLQHRTPPAQDTVDWPEDRPDSPGNLRVDYVLPTRSLHVTAGGVYWPSEPEEARLVEQASRHRLVWVDLALPSAP
ncbi:MAG: endonuclease/exonuclease/phosphatase family protein [Dinoroseobacter sp.]|nr:endonuclease/exonuclease/phosphatase family protein [Dinoroseobacter sp.]